jgi:type IV/VI secretion system ImpK/VasF family protein
MEARDLTNEFFEQLSLDLRILATGGRLDEVRLRQRIQDSLGRMEQRALADPNLQRVFEKIRMPLLFIADDLIARSSAPFAAHWHAHRLAYEEDEFAGDEKFYVLLEEYLKETDPASEEALAVFYRGLSLGFEGWYAGQPAKITGFMKAIAERLPHRFQPSPSITPGAYDALDSRTLYARPPRHYGRVILTLVAAAAFLSLTIVGIYRVTVGDLQDSLQRVNEREPLLLPSTIAGDQGDATPGKSP